MSIIEMIMNFLSGGRDVNIAVLPLIPLLMMGVSALSAVGSGIAGSRKAKENQQLLDGMKNDNETEYLKEYYRGALDNDGAKAYLKRLDNRMRERDKAAENSSVASGSTHENALATKKANNEVMSDAVAGLVQSEEARKDNVKQNYLQRKASLTGTQMGVNNQVAQNWANIGSGISNAAGSLASAYLMGNPLGGGNYFTPSQDWSKAKLF